MNLKKLSLGLLLISGMIGQAFAVATDDNRSNTISKVAASTYSTYILLQTPLLDPLCLYGVLNLPDQNSQAGKMMYALVLSAYTQSLPLTRVYYDRDATTNSCTIAILNM
jgi:hypothetical protein